MSLVNILGGALLLTLGRKIFWLFVALAGFFAGYNFTNTYLNLNNETVVLAIAIVIGLVAAVLAYFLQKIAVGVAGFLIGIYLGTRFLAETAFQADGYEWLVILIAGLLGVLLMVAVFDWALIILSSIAGANLIVEGLQLAAEVALVVGVALFIVGVLVQAGLARGGERPTQDPTPQT